MCIYIGASYRFDQATTIKGKVSRSSANITSGVGQDLKISANVSHKVRPDLLLQIATEICANRLTAANAHKFGIQALIEA